MPSSKPRRPRATWTFLVYLAGDNNLTEEMTWALQEMKKKTVEWRTARRRTVDGLINVAAHFDPRRSRGRRYDFAPPTTSEEPPADAEADGDLDRYEGVVFTPGMIDAYAGTVDGRLASKLSTFLLQQIERLEPADEYFVVLSGHGSGAVGDFLIDLDPSTSLSIPELATILDQGRQAYAKKHDDYEDAERRIPKRISIFGMDSCLMSNAEVCYEVREHARHLVASEGFVSNTGWPYRQVLESLVYPPAGVPDPKVDRVAHRVALSYSSFYRDYEVSGLSTDIAVCNLETFRKKHRGSLVGQLRAFSKECIPRLEALYAHEVRTGVGVKPDKAKRVVDRLARDIGRDLFTSDLEQRALAAKLRGEDRPALDTDLWRADLSPSQVEALRELADSLEGTYHLGPRTIGARLRQLSPTLQEAIVKPRSNDVALAVARVRREFDPGVLEALRLIEERERWGLPSVRTARGHLQKLHQVRWLLDIQDLARDVPPPDDVQLRNALVSARWAAQSFKAGVYVDLFDLCAKLEERVPKGALARRCQGVQKTIEGRAGKGSGAVELSRYTGADFQHAHGLSVYFPASALDYIREYENLEFAEQTGWGRFLRAYLRVTRRERRDERTHWAEPSERVLRPGEQEVDPLEGWSIEARIVGVQGAPAQDEYVRADRVRAGTERRIRAGTEGRIRAGTEGRIKAGTEGRIRAGTEGRIRAGTEGRIRGEGGILALWGNPPDGFFRQ